VLAYAGLRPGEALALTWDHVRERTILVERALALGELKTTKTGRTRTVRLLAPLAADLREWRIAQGRPQDGALIFPAVDSGTWSDDAWRRRYWRRRIFGPAARATGLENPRPYDLRHSFVSLLLAESANVVEVARQAGHSPTVTLESGTPSVPDPILGRACGRRRRAPRRGGRRWRVPENPIGLPSQPRKSLCKSWRADARTRTADPFITSDDNVAEESLHIALLPRSRAGLNSP